MKIRYILMLIFIVLIVLVFVLMINHNKENNSSQNSQIANPASVYCEDVGGILEIRTNPDGSQTGYCIFPDGTECEE